MNTILISMVNQQISSMKTFVKKNDEIIMDFITNADASKLKEFYEKTGENKVYRSQLVFLEDLQRKLHYI